MGLFRSTEHRREAFWARISAQFGRDDEIDAQWALRDIEQAARNAERKDAWATKLRYVRG